MSRSYRPRANRESVPCARCAGTIAAYAGRPLSEYGSRFVHHPGQCADAHERASKVRLEARQGTLFAWSCQHLEPSSYDDSAELCDVMGTDRDEYTAHMRGHGRTPIKSEPRIRLRRKPPAAKLPAPLVAPFKTLRWVKRSHSEWTPERGQECAETPMRGQFWSNGPDPHSVIAITYTAYGSDIRPELVTLYVRADGSVTEDWSEARRSRRDANRRAKYAA